jgi:hypothetical protein
MNTLPAIGADIIALGNNILWGVGTAIAVSVGLIIAGGIVLWRGRRTRP